jgi:hypothetical protein
MNNKHFLDVAMFGCVFKSFKNNETLLLTNARTNFNFSLQYRSHTRYFSILLLMVHSSTVIPLKNKVKLHNIKKISSTPQKTHCASISKTIWLTPFREISLFILRTTWKHVHYVDKKCTSFTYGSQS